MLSKPLNLKVLIKNKIDLNWKKKHKKKNTEKKKMKRTIAAEDCNILPKSKRPEEFEPTKIIIISRQSSKKK